MIDKDVCDKGYAWNPSNCECECDKSCDFGEYLDYENCKCRKRLVDKLVEECNENIHETKLAEIAWFEHKNKCACYYILVLILVEYDSLIFTYLATGSPSNFSRRSSFFL